MGLGSAPGRGAGRGRAHAGAMPRTRAPWASPPGGKIARRTRLRGLRGGKRARKGGLRGRPEARGSAPRHGQVPVGQEPPSATAHQIPRSRPVRFTACKFYLNTERKVTCKNFNVRQHDEIIFPSSIFLKKISGELRFNHFGCKSENSAACQGDRHALCSELRLR